VGSSQVRLSTEVSNLMCFAQVVLVGDAAEVFQQLRLGREVLRPGVVRLEGVAVHVVGVVHPAARIGVHQPRAADVGVFLDNLELDAGLGEPDARQDARHPGAHHQHLQPTSGFLQPRLLELRVLAGSGERQLVQQERRIAFRDRRAGDEIHHATQKCRVRHGDLGFRAWRPRQDGGFGQFSDLGLLVGGDSGVVAV
jgi:hypothetical protein